VIRALLRAAIVSEDSRGPLRLLTQVTEAESPIQLQGWIGAPVGRIASVVGTFVEVDTANSGVGQTTESVNKDIALETLLCSGSRRTSDILAKAIVNETNIYTTAELMRALSVLPLKSVPPRVTNALKDEPGFASRADENTRLVVYLAAARVAASSRSFQDFDALVHSRGLLNGHPLTVPVRGAVTQILWLAQRHRREAVKRTIDGLRSRTPLPQIVAAQALVSLLQEGPIDEAIPCLMGLAADKNAMPYVRTAAVAALTVAKGHQANAEWRDLLVSLCADADGTVRYAGASALIDAGALQEASEVAERLGASSADGARYRALLVGQLASVNPDRFVDVAQSIISSSRSELLHAVLDGFYVGGRHREVSLPTALADAVVARVSRDESEVRSDAPLLQELAELAPQRVLAEEWSDVWHRWMPQSRCTLAELIPGIVQRFPDLQKRGVELLKLLIQDGTFGVRRSAARSLSRIREATLFEWCDEAYRSGSIHLRRLAIEAAAWLPSDSEASSDNQMVRMGLVDDERIVRDAAERAAREMRRRAWARCLLADMKSGAREDERHVQKRYRMSKALRWVGDDEDLRALAGLSRDPNYPPNVAYWYERTRGELEKQWRKTTSEWPEPWRHWDAAVERVQGTLSAGGIDHAADLHLWHRRGKGAEGVSGWGGAGQVESMGDALQLAHGREEVTLTIEGRPPGKALVVSVRNSEVVLTGNGPYPASNVE